MKFFLIIVVLFILMISATLYAEEIVIIANKRYPADHISMTTLREIYLGEKITEGEIRIKPYNQNDSNIKKKFFRKVLNTNEDGFNAYWIKKVFQEGGIPPLMKSSPEDMIRTVKEEVGGIGYIWKREGDISDVKVLLTIDVEE